MLDGVPRIGWIGTSLENTARVVDRLVVEMLLGQTHRRVALKLNEELDDPECCFLTWVPDIWTLIKLREQLPEDENVSKLVYPGHGLRTGDIKELKPALQTFNRNARLMTFEEVWA